MTSNRIVYIISFLVSEALFVFTGSFLALALACMLALFALLLLTGVLLESALGKVSIGVPRTFDVGSAAFMQIDLVKGLPISTALIILEIECRSSTFDTVDVRTVATALNTGSKTSVKIPLDTSHYGRMDISVVQSRCIDALALFERSFPIESSTRCIVYPDDYALTTSVRSVPLSRAFGKTYDENRSGFDVDEVFDVREFQEGDHLASVHWKLSARFDSMMSRQFSRPVDFELIVVSLNSLRDSDGMPIEASILNGVASTGIAISRDFMQQNLSHNYALPLNGVLESGLVDSIDSFSHANELLLDAPISKAYSDAVSSLMVSELAMSFTKCILITPVYDESLWSQLSLEMDLSVVLIVDGKGINEVEGDFDLIVIDIEDLQDHERCIDL